MSETIYFNGKRYDSIAEMPPSVRQQYEKVARFFADANQDGVPDVFQGGGISGLKETFNIIKEIGQMSSGEGLTQEQFTVIHETDTSISVNGKSYSNIDQMPTHVRQVYENVTNTAREDTTNIYDEAWREVEREEFFKPHDDEVLNRQMKGYPQTSNETMESVNSTSRFVFLVVAAFLVLGIAGIAWFVFFL